MVIQRWQSLLLFISALVIGAGLVFPIGSIVCDADSPESSTPMYALDILPLFIVLCLTFVLLLVDIFLYKTLPLQKKVALVCLLLTVVAGVAGGICGSVSVMVMTSVSAILTIVAYTRMKADERLLKSYDRIR